MAEKEAEDASKPKDRLVPYGPAGLMLMENFNLPVMDQVKEFEATKDDVFLCGFPKTGTTWMQAIISMIMRASGTDQADSSLGDHDVNMESFYLECARCAQTEKPPIEMVKSHKPPRLLWTHLSWELLPPSAIANKSKIIFISRNVKDVMVSQYDMFSKIDYLACAHDVKTFDAFAESFMQDNVLCAPFFHNFKSYWDHREEPNVHILTYENLHKDAVTQIKLVADFLEKPLTDKQIQQIAVLTKFENMSKNDNLNKGKRMPKDPKTGEPIFQFLRKGGISGWESHISENLRERIDDWITKEAAKNDLDVAHFM